MLLILSAAEGDDDHHGREDDKKPERQQHEVRPGERQPLGWPQIEDADNEAEGGSCCECDICRLSCGSPPEHTEKEDGGHRRRYETQHRLEDVE